MNNRIKNKWRITFIELLLNSVYLLNNTIFDNVTFWFQNEQNKT